MSQRERIALLHLEDVALVAHAIIAAEHVEGLLVTHDYSLGIILLDESDAAAVVRLHVVHDDIVNLTVADDAADVVEELREEVHLHGVDKCNLVVKDYVRVVAHAVRQRPETLEESLVAVVDANVMDG